VTKHGLLEFEKLLAEKALAVLRPEMLLPQLLTVAHGRLHLELSAIRLSLFLVAHPTTFSNLYIGTMKN